MAFKKQIKKQLVSISIDQDVKDAIGLIPHTQRSKTINAVLRKHLLKKK